MDILECLRRILPVLSVMVGVCYLYQTAYLFLPLRKKRRRGPPPPPDRRRRYAVLIPARNEQAVLPWLLDSIRAQDWPDDRLCAFVLADNCTDGTAAAAREHGAVVYERHDTRRVGKGWALQALLEHIRDDGGWERFDAFLVFDADNLLAPGYIAAIDRTFSAGYETVCGYRSSKNFMDNWISAGYGLWYLHDSAHLNASRMDLGVTCACTGTGFGFTRGLLEQMGGWPFHTLVEDIEFDTWCAVHGVRMGYCAEAVVYDEQPVTFRQSWIQRTRWVQGGVQVSLRYAGRLLKGLFRGSVRDRWGCFENLTLTMFGYGACAVTGALAAAAALLSGGAAGAVKCLALSGAGMYLGLLAVGALTTAQEWARIPGTARQKAVYCLSFPLFMLTYIPIALCACFCRFRWKPVRHTVAIGVGQVPGAGADRHAAPGRRYHRAA